MALFEVQVGKYMEWNTVLPHLDRPRESSTFLIENTEYYLLLCRDFYRYDLYLKLKEARPDLTPLKLSLTVIVLYKNYSGFDCFSRTQVYFNDCDSAIYSFNESASTKQLQLNSGLQCQFKFCIYFQNTVTLSLPSENLPDVSIARPAPKKIRMSSDSSQTIHFQALSKDFSKLLHESSSHDIKITCDGKTFNAHKNVLEARSTVLSAMLNSDMAEGKSGLIEIEDVEADILQSFLQYLYTGTLLDLNIEDAKKLYEVSDKYAVEVLKKACSEILTKNLTESSACEILVLADQHGDGTFRNDVMVYMVQKKMPENDILWLDFSESYPNLAVKVLNLYVRKDRKECIQLD